MTTVSAGQDYIVSAGIITHDDLVLSGGEEYVLGTAISASERLGGTIYVENGGVVSGTVAAGVLSVFAGG